MAESDRLLSDCTPLKVYRGFKSRSLRHYFEYSAPMAQLDRAPDYESGCRRFESYWAYQKIEWVKNNSVFNPFFVSDKTNNLL